MTRRYLFNMIKLAIAAFLGGTLLSSISQPVNKKALAPTFDQTYMVQVQKANAALQVFMITPCTDPTFVEKGKTLKNESEALEDLFNKILDSPESFDTKMRETEIGLGFVNLLTQSVHDQENCQEIEKEKSAPPADNPSNTKS